MQYFTKSGTPIAQRDWHQKAIEMAATGLGATEIAEELLGRKSQESTIRDFLSKVDLSKAEKNLKILFWDIETSPALSAHWGEWQQNINKDAKVRDYGLLTHAWAWGDGEVVSSAVCAEDAFHNEYQSIVHEMWHLLDEADVVVGHNCMEENSKVLTSNFDWVAVKDLKVGDELIGFEEGKSPFTKFRDSSGAWQGQGKTRAIKTCKVTEHDIVKKEAFEVTLSDGSKVITTDDHYWLGKTSPTGVLTWIKTKDLIDRNAHIVKYMDVWEKDQTFEGGWLSGFLDGEGSVSLGKDRALGGFQVCQRKNAAWGRCLSYLKDRGIKHSEPRVKVGGIGRGDCEYIYATGKWQALSLIGSLDITRFKENFRNGHWGLGTLTSCGAETLTVASVEPVGVKNIVIMGTDSSTYFAEGFAMHNCKKFDIKRANAEFIKAGLPPPSPYKTYDTLKVAKSKFKFPRNDLGSLCKYLGVEHSKLQNDGMPLWMECIMGNSRALKDMEEYNRGDIYALRDVFYRLLPWDNQGINFGLYGERLQNHLCTHCGSSELETLEGKYAYTSNNSYQVYRCSVCGAISRTRNSSGKRNQFMRIGS